ncbi:MAG: MFS transporter [Corynebacterium sp.]|nr:MFS transporter [Corynebacterium sp.]
MTYIHRGEKSYTRAIIAILLAGLATFNCLYCTQALLPTLSHSFNLSADRAALSISMATAALAICVVPASVLSERWGRGRILLISVTASSVLSILLPLSPTFQLFIAGRFLQGMFIAGVPAVAMTWLAEEIAPRDLPRAMGIYISGNSIGGLVGRIIPALLIEWMSWHFALLASGILAFACALGMIFLLPKQQNFRPKKITLTGELRAMASHWMTPSLVHIFLIGFLIMGAFVTMFNYAGYHLIDEFGLSDAHIGAIFFVYLMGSVTSARIGWAIDKAGRGKTLLATSTAMAVGALLTIIPNLVLFIIGIIIFTGAFFAAHSTVSGWIGSIAKKNRAEASSTYLLCYYLGSSVLGWATGHVLTAFGWAPTVACMVGMAVAAALLALSLRRLTKRPSS